MLWYTTVWYNNTYSAAWSGTVERVWHGMLWYIVWYNNTYSITGYGSEVYKTIWYNNTCIMVRYGTVDRVWQDISRHSRPTVDLSTVRYDREQQTRYSTVRYGTIDRVWQDL